MFLYKRARISTRMQNISGNNQEKAKNIKFLSDQPLGADKEQEIRFGHRSIADSLVDIVYFCSMPFTMGLFGKWGTGKTTILDALKRKLSGKNVATVNIDAWKHEGDALRRTFLEDTVDQLKGRKNSGQYDYRYLDKYFTLSEGIRKTESKSQSSVTYNWSFLIPVILIILVALALGYVLVNWLFPNNLGMYVSIVAGGGLIAGILILFLQQSSTTETKTSIKDFLQDPIEFEGEFKKILKKINAERLLIIIDNLDRVTCEKAVELLSTIKTYLEQDKCIFLIACDADAIKKHLRRLYAANSEEPNSSNKFDDDEFLRKFFNGYLRIPEFIDTELLSYTESLLKETGLPDEGLSNEVISDITFVISKAFRDNPRQIKQFINTLLSHYLLAKKRESDKELPPGIVTGKLAYLAKDLIIWQEFNEYYDSISLGQDIDSSDEKLKDFLRTTEPIDVKDKIPFRYLKLSEEEIEMPEIRDLQPAMEDNKTDLVKEIVETFKDDKTKLGKFDKFTTAFIYRNRGRGIVLFYIVSSTLSALQQLGLELGKYFYVQIAGLLQEKDGLGARLSMFFPNLIFEQILVRCEEQRDSVIQNYIDQFWKTEEIDNTAYGKEETDKKKYIRDLVAEFIKHKDWIYETKKQKVRAAINEKHCNYDVLSLFFGNVEAQKEFIHEDTVSTFISSISGEDIEYVNELNSKVKVISELEPVIKKRNLKEVVSKFTELLKSENEKGFSEEKQNLLDCLYGLINTFNDRILELGGDSLNPLADEIIKGVNALGTWEEKRIFMPISFWLVGEEAIDEQYESQIESALNAFFANASSDGIRSVLDKLKTKSEKESLLEYYEETFKNRVLNDQSLLELLYPLATKEVRTKWLEDLIKANHQRAIETLEWLNYRVDDRKRIVSDLLAKAKDIPISLERGGLYEVCNKMKCANDAEAKSTLASYIKSHLTDTTPDVQGMGLDVLKGADYLSQTQKREIAEDTINWLSPLEPNSVYQPSSVESVAINWHILYVAQKQSFIHFIFIKLIKDSSNVEGIKLGFDTLSRLEPKIKYEEDVYTPYFNDIKANLESEGMSEKGMALAEGLLKLKPEKLNNKNRRFWNNVQRFVKPGT